MLSCEVMQGRLHHIIDNAHHVSQLLPILQLVNIEEIKRLIKNKIRSPDTVRRSYYRLKSIGDILPPDVIKHVLSFANSNEHQSVCHEWKKICSSHADHDFEKRYGPHTVKYTSIKQCRSAMITFIFYADL